MRRPGPSELALFALSGLSLAALGAAPLGCGNPAVDSRIEALGEENPNVPPSEFHRPGQPCVLCHSVYEAAEPEITVGGTIFASPAKNPGELPTAVEGAEISLVDAEGEVKSVTTNCAGNFFLTKEQWNPSFPLRVEVRYPSPSAPEQDYHELSHGESFLAMLRSGRFDGDGFFVLDEPEAGLSFTAQLALVGTLHHLAARPRAQVLIATHSPILASLPGAWILELDDTGFHETNWEDLELVNHHRSFLQSPQRYLRHVLTD